MREKQIEQKLVRAVRAAGGLCPKFVSPGLAGMPDRLILLPGGRFAFVEVKAPGEKPRALQLHRHAQLRALGFSVFVLDDPARVPVILDQAEPIPVVRKKERKEAKRLKENGPEESGVEINNETN